MKYLILPTFAIILLCISSSCSKKISGAAARQINDSISGYTSDLVRRYGTTIPPTDSTIISLEFHLEDLKFFLKDKGRPCRLHKLLYQYYQYANTLKLLSVNTSLNLTAFANTLSMLNEIEAKLAVEMKKKKPF